MSIKPVKPWKGFLDEAHSEGVWQSLGSPHSLGHTHLWERGLSRRNFVRAAAGLTGVTLASRFVQPPVLRAQGGTTPNPIHGGTHFPFLNDDEIIHLFGPGRGNEPSTITDFAGSVGIGNATGIGTATDTSDGSTRRLAFGADCRFMKGRYIGQDGELHSGTFGFI
jgi:hypothetical protein